jgi:hypothetical protein
VTARLNSIPDWPAQHELSAQISPALLVEQRAGKTFGKARWEDVMKGSAALRKEASERDSWKGFRPGDWCTSINVRDFIVRNVTPYAGDEKFLAGQTAALFCR